MAKTKKVSIQYTLSLQNPRGRDQTLPNNASSPSEQKRWGPHGLSISIPVLTWLQIVWQCWFDVHFRLEVCTQTVLWVDCIAWCNVYADNYFFPQKGQHWWVPYGLSNSIPVLTGLQIVWKCWFDVHFCLEVCTQTVLWVDCIAWRDVYADNWFFPQQGQRGWVPCGLSNSIPVSTGLQILWQCWFDVNFCLEVCTQIVLWVNYIAWRDVYADNSFFQLNQVYSKHNTSRQVFHL